MVEATKVVETNPLRAVLSCGQSLWYDNISREILHSGELRRMIAEDGVRGVTSNPTIFEKAVTGSDLYKKETQELFCNGKNTEEIYEALVLDDIRAAADLLRSVYNESRGEDGYVSLEVSPALAHDTGGTVAEAKRLFAKLGRENVMIKVPATASGVEAIAQLIAAGVNINVTLIFSLTQYEHVADAYLRGLEGLEQEGKPLNAAASVASVFVSRLDTAVDKILAASAAGGDRAGRAGIANAKAIYDKFKEIFAAPRFARLEELGARVQRPLWASTGVKNPRYSDVLYAEALIGPRTVNTLPPATMAAFRDHGVARNRLEEGVEEAKRFLSQLPRFGVDLEQVTAKLQYDGVESFAKSYAQLLQGIETQAQGAVCDIRKGSVARYRPWLNEAYRRLEQAGFVRRVWERDATLWRSEPDHQAIIRNALGWLTVAETMPARVSELTAFAEEIRAAGFRHALLLGMGGSSLAPEVFRLTFGVQPGHPDLRILDSSDPAMIARHAAAIDLASTLFLVASKSGGTPESVYLEKCFYEQVKQVKGESAGENFVAITDAGTALEKLARERRFRRVFLNFKDIGGRYSALSYFGLVPAALIGADVQGLLASAQRMAAQCGSSVPVKENPGAHLGAILGELAASGRDKLTLVLSQPIASLGAWIEQLIAESTGKEGRGILPVDGEDLGEPAVYGRDRVFVSLELPGVDGELDAKLARLEEAGHPVVRLTVPLPLDIGGEFFRWEFATAIAGAVLGINAFDQPDVQESKDNTKRLIEGFRATGSLPETAAEAPGAVVGFLRDVRPPEYVAILVYVDRNAANEAALQRLRLRIRDRFGVATTVGFGPRFLHSTGQLHKGGAANGRFVQITADSPTDMPIPGEPFSFAVLEEAQALGDLESLQRHGRRVLRVNLSGDLVTGLEEVEKSIARAA